MSLPQVTGHKGLLETLRGIQKQIPRCPLSLYLGTGLTLPDGRRSWRLNTSRCAISRKLAG